MALFFDQQWFDARLGELNRTRAELADALGLSPTQIDDMWKDQREVRAAEVTAMARFFHTSAAEIADRCGISTPDAPEPGEQAAGDLAMLLARLDSMDKRLYRLETMLAEIRNLQMSQAGRSRDQ